MKPVETIRIVPGAKTAVLMMHGIAGTPNHFRELMPLEDMIPESWSLYNILLPGHGGTVRDFSRRSMAAWEGYTMDIFRDLCRNHEQVILIGHSMGTLFAMDMALARPDKVAFLFLLGVPLRVGVRAVAVCNLIRFSFGWLNPENPIQMSMANACSIPPTAKFWQYIGWIPRMVELVRKMHAVSDRVQDLQVPTIAFQSLRDEMVSNRTASILRNAGTVEVHELVPSTHFYYHPDDIATMRQRFADAGKEMITPPTA